MRKLDTLQNVERFIFGQMTDSERHTFLECCKDDEKLQREVVLFIEFELALQELGMERSFEQLKETYTQYKEERNSFFQKNLGLFLIFFVGMFTIIYQFSNPSEAIYQQIAAHAPPSFSKHPKTSKIASLAKNDFINERYKAALSNLHKLSKLSDDKEITLYIGICHLELKNYYEAFDIFSGLKNKEDITNQEVEWYYFLTLLRMDVLHKTPRELEALSRFCKKQNQSKPKLLIEELKKAYDLKIDAC